MTPQQLLDQADQLLTTSTTDTRGRWPRACAWLIRLALEKALDQYWARILPEAALCPMRPQLLLLLESALVKLSAVASKLTTISAQDMITAMIAGQRDPSALAGGWPGAA